MELSRTVTNESCLSQVETSKAYRKRTIRRYVGRLGKACSCPIGRPRSGCRSYVGDRISGTEKLKHPLVKRWAT